ncbi:ketopantoate reductase family protein [Evansella cellulosilytica]|uniref:2-dehydropantoate 2-reductase n=1 Tax=Evansella cellulosilytica (strain ATCC 21833 / DSM 2522 / FERM P-1141 / JCM 9156 / N-4) TaxID=649639 RepID=E6TUB7_EVAC2|nr:ketopantoate reductase family protein [Evansella cellulosilytica]ADU29673.1 2-dehydropantoate 2-reductase [Evansella cellulosilytica DSM 2522]
MKILIVGAGAVGGYFGGRLIEKGEDVTFLVREQRKQQLQEHGLVINSVHGDVKLHPKMIVGNENDEPFDIVIIATKAYHLEDGLRTVEPFVREYTTIIPLLNGIEHMELLHTYFSPEQVLGGLCFIEATLNKEGAIIQKSNIHSLIFGEWSGKVTDRAKEIENAFSNTKASFQLSENIQQEMWHKYLFISTFSGITALMRSPIGPIRDTMEGRTYIQQLFEEIRITMVEHGAPIATSIVETYMRLIDQQHADMKSSMLRDIEKGAQIEADHLQGYLLLLAERVGVETPLLRLIYQHLKVYEKNYFRN